MPTESNTIKTVHFPSAGLELSVAFGQQPARETAAVGYARTTADAVNVRAFEPLTDRCRGGSRSGLRKYVAGICGSSNLIQHLTVLVDPQAQALWGNYRSVYQPLDGSDPYYIQGGSPGPGFPGPYPSYYYSGPYPTDPVPGRRDPVTGVWDGPNITPDPGYLIDGVYYPAYGSLAVPRPVAVVNVYGWPNDQFISVSGQYYPSGARAEPNPSDPDYYPPDTMGDAWGWNSTGGTRAWRGPPPAEYVTTPKGVIITARVAYMLTALWFLGVEGADVVYGNLLLSIGERFDAGLDESGWYGTAYAVQNLQGNRNDTENMLLAAIPYDIAESNGLPVPRDDGGYGRLAVVLFCQYESTFGEIPTAPFCVTRSSSPTGGNPFDSGLSSYDGWSVLDQWHIEDPFNPGADPPYVTLWQLPWVSDLRDQWEALADQYSRIDVLAVAFQPNVGTSGATGMAAFSAAYDNGLDLIRAVVGESAGDHLTTATFGPLFTAGVGYDLTPMTQAAQAILDWLDTLD